MIGHSPTEENQTKFVQRKTRNLTKGSGIALLPSSLQLTELLLFRDEFLDICEWLCECEGLESAERRDNGG